MIDEPTCQSVISLFMSSNQTENSKIVFFRTKYKMRPAVLFLKTEIGPPFHLLFSPNQMEPPTKNNKWNPCYSKVWNTQTQLVKQTH